MKVFVVLLVLAVALGGAWWYRSAHAATPADAAMATTPVVRSPIVQSVSSTGTVASLKDVPIKCQASGVVLQVGPNPKKPLDQGDIVHAGDLLLKLDPVIQQRLEDQAKAKVDVSKALLEQAKQNLIVSRQQVITVKMKANADLMSAQAQEKDARAKAARRKALLDKQLGTQEDYDAAAAALAQAQANVELAKAEVEDAKTTEFSLGIKEQQISSAAAQVDLDQDALDAAHQQTLYTVVTVPDDLPEAVVTVMTVTTGTVMSSATSVVGAGSGTSTMTLADLSQLFILADVDEADYGGIDIGQDVTITADAYPKEVFMGKVVRKAPLGINVSNVVTFEVKIEVLSKNKSKLKPNMTTNVKILEAKKDDCLMAPALAVIKKGKKDTVTVQKPDGSVEDRTVEIGLTDGTNDEIISGVKEGELVQLHKGATDSRWNGQPNGQQPRRPGGGGLGGGRG